MNRGWVSGGRWPCYWPFGSNLERWRNLNGTVGNDVGGWLLQPVRMEEEGCAGGSFGQRGQIWTKDNGVTVENRRGEVA